MSKVVITGVAGLLGQHLSRYLLDQGHYVIGIDDLSGGYYEFLPQHDDFQWLEFDLANDYSILKSLFQTYKPDVCYHFAAYAAEGLSPFIRKYNYVNNVVASANVINSCITHDCKLVFTSSMAVYGNSKPPFTESMTPKPIDPYGIAKYAVEMDIQCASEQHGLRHNIIRPHNVLGIYQNIWDRYRNVIGIFIRKTLNNEPMIIYGDGSQVRAFSDIQYYLKPFAELMSDTYNGEIFNIGADKYWSILDVAKMVEKIGLQEGYQSEIVFAEPRHEVKEAYCSHAKAKLLLDFNDETNLENLVREMFNWAKDQKSRETRHMDYEITKGIYEYWK
jgi:UDP-glucose 4-epimerase